MLHFLGIGAQKCGTTWLYEQLRTHPQVAFPGLKEVHYWDQPQGRGVDWYRSLFPDDGKHYGDITPAYAFQPISVVREIKENFPAVRLFYVIRNPIDRAWSAALMTLRKSERRINDVPAQWFIEHFNTEVSRARGDYEKCIRNWREVFGAKRLKIYHFETLCDRPKYLLKDLCQHLEIDDTHFDRSDDAHLQRKVFAGSGEDIPSDLRRTLAAMYTPQIEALQQYLQTDLGHWLRSNELTSKG